MRIKSIIVVSLLFAAASAQAVTNSWKVGSTFWDISAGSWSAGLPSINNEVVLITNVNSKLVTIDADTVSGAPSTLTISNLVVGGLATPVITTNTLFLSNMQTNTPLHVFNSLLISNAGVVQITNSFLQVDGVSGGIFELDGTLQLFPRAKVVVKTAKLVSGAVLQFALGSNTSPIVVSNNLTIAGTLNVIDGGGFSNATTYTLFTYGGTLTNNGLTIGSIPTNFAGAVSTATAGQVNLIVSNVTPAVASFTASPISNTAPLAVTFTDASLGAPPLSLTWNLGDGPPTNTAGGASFVHTYLAGTYTVTLTASNAYGNTTLTSNNLITAIAQALTPFQQWQTQYFSCTNCSQAQPDADPLGKGISNTNQFLAGFNPTNTVAYPHVISIARTNTTDIKVTYLGANGDSTWSPGIVSRTNVLEFTAGTAGGSYSNNFTSTGQTNIFSGGTGTGIVANIVDSGGATNTPSRFYRIRVLTP